MRSVVHEENLPVRRHHETGEGHTECGVRKKYVWRETVQKVQSIINEEWLLHSLTPRQRQILTLIAQGYNTKRIALGLNISPKTVESHRAHLMERLRIHDLAGLVRFAIRMGLVKAEER